ncbi:MAG TPA: carbamoyltransferase C-terminal domain-containing protein [Smithellaceae bacterium]|nr:carbamoyltransferase C-terminal domain-containing protein [Smithella sp.]HPL97496.1 carbamoyltransferase C-terminal domain-containing protein [Smithellaceae bacterium]
MNVLGLSSFVHDSAACLIKHGELVANVEEERFNRIKHTDAFPIQSIKYVLYAGNIQMSEVDAIAFNWNPYKSLIAEIIKFALVPITYYKVYRKTNPPKNFRSIAATFKLRRIIDEHFPNQFKGKIVWVDHHLAHLASSYYLSPFSSQNADVIIMDAHGDDCSASVFSVKDHRLHLLWKIPIFHSLGILYTNFTNFLGFKDFEEGKTMALASYGRDTYQNLFQKIIELQPKGRYRITDQKKYLALWSYMNGNLEKELGKKRNEGEPLEQRHFDIAHSMQNRIKEAILHMLHHVAASSGNKNLALSGGIFLNCDVNKEIILQSGYEQIFIPPFASDTGGAVGAALCAAFQSFEKIPTNKKAFSPYLGPEYKNEEILTVIKKYSVNYKKIEYPWKKAAEYLKDDKIIGWFQGRMEAGPRALGNRSILANPFSRKIRDRLNLKIKGREYFRPFGPITTVDAALNYFDLRLPLPELTRYMLLTVDVKPEYRSKLPGITHVDGTARIQVVTEEFNPDIYRLLLEFENLTGYAVLINTSFNRHAPIVCSPEDALDCYQTTKLDALFIGNYQVE